LPIRGAAHAETGRPFFSPADFAQAIERVGERIPLPLGKDNGFKTVKQYIVLIALIALGIFLYGLIAGSGEDSLTSISGKVLYDAARESAGT
jgi:hypothetical protein